MSTLITALALALLAALAALGISLFLDSFSRHDNTQYEPKDMPREIQLQRESPDGSATQP